MIKKEEAQILRDNGMTYKEIGDVFGVSRQRIQQLLYDRNKLKWQRTTKPREIDDRAMGLLKNMNLPVEYSELKSLCDIYVGGRLVEVRSLNLANGNNQLHLMNLNEIDALFLFVGDEWFLLPAKKLTKNMRILYPHSNKSKYAALMEKYREPSVDVIRKMLRI